MPSPSTRLVSSLARAASSLVAPALLAFPLALPVSVAPAQDAATPSGVHDPSIPTLEQVVGHDFGEEISSHAQVEAYLQAVAAASPRVELVTFGESWEGRRLWYAIVGEPELLAVWQDPEFDPTLKAFYYARVIEIPTPRWTAYDAVRYELEMPRDVELVTQERAYTSPIWYTPN